MRAISLWQPWASLVACGAKRIETRHWPTSYRGPLAIHAAKRWTRELREQALEHGFREALWPDGNTWPLPLGAIVCVVDLDTCALIVHPGGTRPGVLDPLALRAQEKDFGNYEAGRYAWGLKNLRRLAEPIPFRGAQGFFDVPDELLNGRVFV